MPIINQSIPATTPTTVLAAGYVDFIHIFNNSANWFYLNYVGGAADASSTPLAPNGFIMLENVKGKAPYVKGLSVYCIAGPSIINVTTP